MIDSSDYVRLICGHLVSVDVALRHARVCDAQDPDAEDAVAAALDYVENPE